MEKQTAAAEKSRDELKKSVIIGGICIAAYLANYCLRNILSVLTPAMLKTGIFTTEHIALLSSVYMFFYAVGQLLNGVLGDIFDPKKMILIGQVTAGASLILFPFVKFSFLQICCFALLGFALSMVRGPMMKIISENTKQNHARIICVFFSFTSYAGPFLASILAMLFHWNWALIAAGAITVFIAISAYMALTVLEKRKAITFQSMKGTGLKGIFALFKIKRFVFFMVSAALVEIFSASISFWIPTYLTGNLGFDTNTANIIFSCIAVLRSAVSFLALIVFKLLREKDLRMIRISFGSAAVFFTFMLFVGNRWLVIIFMLLALMSVGLTTTLLWSIYIPSLGKTGRVSSANGVLDCTGYVVASGANMLFGGLITHGGWNSLNICWIALCLVGIGSTFVRKRTKE